MSEEKNDVKKDEEKLKKEEKDNLESEVLDELSENEDNDSRYVTREINLDDLYDGAVNNTVVIDPVTNNEVLLSSKRPNYTILGIIIAIGILLVLYYINNKSDLGRTTKDVEPKTTTVAKQPQNDTLENGTLTCTYSSKSDAESQNVTYTADYEDGLVIKSNFNYVVVSNTDNKSAVVEDLKTQYEDFFINNVSVNGNDVSYEKNSKGFTFNVETNYKRDGFDGLVINDNQTILFVKPSVSDTVEILKEKYEDKGFTCSLNNKQNEE